MFQSTNYKTDRSAQIRKRKRRTFASLNADHDRVLHPGVTPNFWRPTDKKKPTPNACIAFLFTPPFAQNSPALVAVMVRFSSRLVSWSAPNDHPLPRTSFGADRRAGSPGFSGWVKEIERLPFPSIMRHSARLAFIA